MTDMQLRLLLSAIYSVALTALPFPDDNDNNQHLVSAIRDIARRVERALVLSAPADTSDKA